MWEGVESNAQWGVGWSGAHSPPTVIEDKAEYVGMDTDGRVGVLESECLCKFFFDCFYFVSEVGRKVRSWK